MPSTRTSRAAKGVHHPLATSSFWERARRVRHLASIYVIDRDFDAIPNSYEPTAEGLDYLVQDHMDHSYSF